jgi:hypothetical protein
MWNNNIFWVLFAPGVVSCVCFAVEGFCESWRGFSESWRGLSESWRRGFEAVGRSAGRIW